MKKRGYQVKVSNYTVFGGTVFPNKASARKRISQIKATYPHLNMRLIKSRKRR